jgi:pimeloyl-ACP methyl ester carboxylesterase
MQFFYQFPQRVERLALISSGGLGQQVSPMLRGAALPGAAAGIWLVANRRVRAALDGAGERMRARGSRKGVYLQAVARAMRPLQDAAARHAFLATLRAVIDVRGQHVSAMDRLYLLGELPTLIVWGERDNTIPMAHGLAAHERIPNSRFVTLPKAAHFPNLEDPEGLAEALLGWLDETEPGLIEDSEWGQIVGARSPRRQRFAPGAPEGTTPSPAPPSGSPE